MKEKERTQAQGISWFSSQLNQLSAGSMTVKKFSTFRNECILSSKDCDLQFPSSDEETKAQGCAERSQSFLRPQSSPKQSIWTTGLLMGWGSLRAPPLPSLIPTSLKANDTLLARLPREVTSLVPAAARLPLGLLAAHCCPQHAIPQATR